MEKHEEYVRKILENRSPTGILKSRESSSIEFKESYNKSNMAKYIKTMAAYANNKGGYIIFGVKDNPRTVVGLKNNTFDSLNQEQFSETINSFFMPAIEWESGFFMIEVDNPLGDKVECKIGWIYTSQAEYKPVIAQKEGDKIASGDVFYRYRARTEKIKYAEMSCLINERVTKEREKLLRLIEVIRDSNTANLGIVNYTNGKLTTPYGVDVAFDRKLVTKVLQKAKFIKEGSFHETEGIPVIKVTGNIDLAEEVPVPEGNPDETHPYIQKQLAEKLEIKAQDLYALIWYYKLKEAKKYHLEITTSKNGKIHKFSEFALQFLKEKLKEFNTNQDEFSRIRVAYKTRDKIKEVK